MIVMSKKGVNAKKEIQNAVIGVREDDRGGAGVMMRLDDFEILFSVERAESFIAQMQSKVRKAKEIIEDNKMPAKQEGLPMSFDRKDP